MAATITANSDWMRVVFADECDADGRCPLCAIDFADCMCPAPALDEEFEYEERHGALFARRRKPH